MTKKQEYIYGCCVLWFLTGVGATVVYFAFGALG